MSEKLILAINPGSTSTKIGLFKGEQEIFKESIEHDHKEIEKYGSIVEQKDMRRDVVIECLKKHGYTIEQLSAVVGRGGLFPPISTGGYKVNQKMKDLVLNEEISPHASNLGCILADGVASQVGIPAFIYDAVSAGNLLPIATVTGMAEVTRRSLTHVLNSRAMAIDYAKSIGKKYEDLNLIIVHLGGGISLSVHIKGELVDSLADDMGPFSPERSGSIPVLEVIELCYSGKFTKKEMQKKVRGNGGLKSLVGTTDCREVEKMIDNGDEHAKLVLEAMAYNVAKGVGSLAPILKGNCDAIILTGGVARSKFITDRITEYTEFISKVVVLPGELELEALAMGALRIIEGLETAHEM